MITTTTITATTGRVKASIDMIIDPPASAVDTMGLPKPPVVAVETILVMLVKP